MTRQRNRNPPWELSPREAAERYLRRRGADSTEKSIDAWRYRLKLFWEWCDDVGIEEVQDLTGYDLDEFYELRSSEIAPVTLEGEMWTLKMYVQYLEDLDAVDDGLADAVRIPNLDPEDRSNDEKLATDDALALLQYHRETPEAYGTRRHAFLELAWFTGARQGGLRALDVHDVHLGDDPWVDFRHRPQTGTPLKNKLGGERPVGIRQDTADALREYKRKHRNDVHDEHGRQPFLASRDGRPTENTLRNWSYLGTEPCLHGPCPHGKNRATCDWTAYSAASKCPSSRSPHKIRTGAITWFLNRGWPPEDVAERVNASVKTIEQHYDKADLDERRRRLRQRMENRRRPLLNELEISEEHDGN